MVLGSNSAGSTLLRNLAIPFTSLCQCLSDETLNAVSSFYLVFVPGEVNDPTQGVNV